MPPDISKESRSRPIKELFPELAEKLSQARTRLSLWGIQVPSDSRLHAAERMLRDTGNSGVMAAEESSETAVLRALWTAADFIDIAEYLPPERVKSIRTELDVAVKGAFWPATGNRQALQFQTQHWIGAVLQHAGLDLEHARYSSRRQQKIPEFYVENGTERYGIEVKRPESSKRISAAIVSARDKFHDCRCKGGVVIEASDCLEGVSRFGFAQRLSDLADIAYATVWQMPDRGFQPGFNSIMYVGVVARGAWQIVEAEVPRLQASGIAHNAHFVDAPNSLADHRARWLQQCFMEAFDGIITRVGE